MTPHILSQGGDTEQSPTHKTPWVFQIKTQEEQNMSSKVTWCLMAFKVTFQKSKNIKTISNLKATWQYSAFRHPLLHGTEEHCGGWGADQLQEGDQPLPGWGTSTPDHRRNLTQKHEALRMRANTLGTDAKHWSTAECPEKGSGAGEGSGTQVLIELAGAAGGAEPRENEAQEGPLLLPTTTSKDGVVRWRPVFSPR